MRLLSLPTLVAVSLYIGISYLDSDTSLLDTSLAGVSIEYNAYSEGINTVLYDEQGNISYTLKAERQFTYEDESTELENPFIQLYRLDDSRWNIAANSGNIATASSSNSSTIESIQLSGDVEVFNLDATGSRVIISTDSLSVDPELETLTTESRVTVVTDQLQQSSTGMIARLKSDEILFIRDIRGQYAQTSN